MKGVRNVILPLFALVFTTGLAASFWGCSGQSPQQPFDNMATVSLSKHGGESPLFASATIKFHQNAYLGGRMDNGGTTFHLQEAALTPPGWIKYGKDVTVTMLIEKRNRGREVRFTFRPDGSRFDPPAEVGLEWSVTGSSKPKLYYIDKKGNYIEQPSDDVELQGNRLRLFIHHFSEYAVSEE